MYIGGIGELGVMALREFVLAGGTLITFNKASVFADRSTWVCR